MSSIGTNYDLILPFFKVLILLQSTKWKKNACGIVVLACYTVYTKDKETARILDTNFKKAGGIF